MGLVQPPTSFPLETIHFGLRPIFGNTHLCLQMTRVDVGMTRVIWQKPCIWNTFFRPPMVPINIIPSPKLNGCFHLIFFSKKFGISRNLQVAPHFRVKHVKYKEGQEGIIFVSFLSDVFFREQAASIVITKPCRCSSRSVWIDWNSSATPLHQNNQWFEMEGEIFRSMFGKERFFQHLAGGFIFFK